MAEFKYQMWSRSALLNEVEGVDPVLSLKELVGGDEILSNLSWEITMPLNDREEGVVYHSCPPGYRVVRKRNEEARS